MIAPRFAAARWCVASGSRRPKAWAPSRKASAVNTQFIFLIVIVAVFAIFMVRSGRKRQRDQLALTQGLKPGAEVMTTFGVYGTIKSIDDAENKIVLSTGPGSELTIHRQALGRIVPTAETGPAVPPSAGTASLNGEPVVVDDTTARTATDGGSSRATARATERPTD